MEKQVKGDPPSFNEQLWEEIWDILLLPDEQASNAADVPSNKEDAPDRLAGLPD
ncbi:MAG: hypothetical protein ACJ74J_18610 [Blastocatellia bacterium]